MSKETPAEKFVTSYRDFPPPPPSNPPSKYEPGQFVLVDKKICDSGVIYLWMKEWGPGALKWMMRYKSWMYLAYAVPTGGFPVSQEDGPLYKKGEPIIPTRGHFDIGEDEILGVKK